MPAVWAAAIRQSRAVLPLGARVIPFAPRLDTTGFFAEFYSAAWSGVVAVAMPSGAITRIARFHSAADDQTYAGGFDGRWLVWVDQLSMQNSDDWEIWAWDSAMNESFEIAKAPRVGGEPVRGPIVLPVVASGSAAWIQANASGTGDVHLFSLAERRDRILESGATPPVLFWGTRLVWQHLDVPGQSGHLEMWDPDSGAVQNVPAPLSSIHHLAFLAVSDKLVAWTDGHQIWAYRPNEQTATLMYEMDGDSAGFLGIAGNLITWDGSTGPYALDVRSASVTALTPAYGGRFAAGSSLVIYWPDTTQPKSSGAAFAIADVDVAKLPPLPTCSQ